MSVEDLSIPRTFGAVLLGGFFATILSGGVSIQTYIYYKIYHTDFRHQKILVFAVWFLDLAHTSFIWVALWDYLIAHYGEVHRIDVIPWSIALTIILTAILTFLVHCFYAHRIFLLSKKKWTIALPVYAIAVLRLVSATVTTAKMIALGTFTSFISEVKWVFTLGLALSTAVDILITASLVLLFRTNKSRNSEENLNVIINTLILYAFETGALTCAGTVVSMLCWLTMSSNLIFLGLHFVIGKFYANSLLVTLNTRRSIRLGHSSPSGGGHGTAIIVMDPRGGSGLSPTSDATTSADFGKRTELHINVERSVQYTTDYHAPKPGVIH